MGAAWIGESPLAGLDALEVRDPSTPEDLEGLALRAYPSMPFTPSLDPRALLPWAPGPVLLRTPPGVSDPATLAAHFRGAEQCAAYGRVLLGGPLGPAEIEAAIRLARPVG